MQNFKYLFQQIFIMCYLLCMIKLSLRFYDGFPRSLDSGLTSALQDLSVTDTHLVEVDGDTLSLYGSGALECLDRNWSVQTAGMVTTVSFTFIEFDEIVQVLPKFPFCCIFEFFSVMTCIFRPRTYFNFYLCRFYLAGTLSSCVEFLNLRFKLVFINGLAVFC